MDEKIYELFLESDSVTLEELRKLGLTTEEIVDITELRLTSNGLYRLKNVEGLYAYGESLAHKGDNYRADRVFQKCLQYDPYHMGTTKRALFKSLILEDYDTAISYLDVLIYANTATELADFRFIIFMMGFFTDLPEKYAKLNRRHKIQDLLVPIDSSNYTYPALINSARALCFKQRFYEAGELFKTKIAKNEMTFEERLMEKLISLAKKGKAKTNRNITDLLGRGDIESLLTLLERESGLHWLYPNRRSLLYLARDIISMRNTGQIPESKDSYSENIMDLICSRQYERAYIANMFASQNTHFASEHDKINYLLREVLRQKNAIMKESITAKFSSEFLPLRTERDILLAVLILLTEGKKDEALKLVDTCLASKSLECYCYVVDDLVELSCLEEDTTFYRPLSTLCRLLSGTFKMDMPKLLGYIRYYLTSSRFQHARIYLHLVEEAEERGHNDMPQIQFEESLKEIKQTLALKESQIAGLKSLTMTPIKKGDEN